jgi:Tfp pilus assembly protein PilP
MGKILKIITVIILFVSGFAYAEDPFSRSFSTPSTLSTDAATMENEADGIHPMMKYDITKYFVKGVIASAKGSIAVMGIPGGKDYIMFTGDPIGNDLHIIKTITQDYIIAGKNSSDEEVTISVSNPILSSGM